MTDNSYWIGYEVNVASSRANLEPYKDNDLHITLAYLGKGEEQTTHHFVEVVNALITKSVRYYPGSFSTDGQNIALWNGNFIVLEGLDIPSNIKAMRQHLVNDLYCTDVWFSTKYSWDPHITLAKMEKDKYYNMEDYGIIKQEIEISRIFFHTPDGRMYWDLS